MIGYLCRALRFLRRNLFRNTRYFVEYAAHFFDPGYQMHPRYLAEDTLVAEVGEGKSLIRIGDGEIYLMNYGSIHYQPYHPRLRAYFIEMLESYRTDSPYRLGIPKEYLGKSNRELRRIGLLNCWLPFKVAYRQRFHKTQEYFDAHLFYRNGSFGRVLERALFGKKVLLVTSRENWKLVQEAGMKERLDVEHIECAASDAFKEFDTLCERIRERVGTEDRGNFRILAAAGPASKALAYVLSKESLVTYDLGRGIEAVYRPNTIEALI